MKTSLAAAIPPLENLQPARGVISRPSAPPSARVERQRDARFPLLLGVEFKTEYEFVLEHATNLAAGGLFVSTALRPPRDTRVQIRLRLPNGEALETTGRVAFLVEAKGQACGGLGLELARDDAAFASALEAYLASLA